MLIESNDWELIWQLFKDISLSLWILIPLLWRYCKQKYLKWEFPRLEKNKKGIKNLERVVNMLFQINKWLSSNNSELIKNVRHDLVELTWNIYLIALSYAALHSTEIFQRELALRNLSQASNPDSINSIILVVQGIANDQYESDSIRKLAKVVLEELKEKSNKELN
ncbi:MAG TPA: hypothetical protein PLP19_19720 [bacterium]|nr:hypothetical protein [bacterium]HPN45725.1 hypothetical protein [bacterium]